MAKWIVGLLFIILNVFNVSNAIELSSYSRDSISLNGKWRYIVDPYENGFYNYRWQKFDDQSPPSKNAFFTDSKVSSKSELLEYNFDQAKQIQVPGDWNTQDQRLYFYEGSVWYRKKFDFAGLENNERAFIQFGAVNYRADVYLNGKKLGVHKGGFTGFRYEVSKLLLKGSNSLVLKVDNKRGADEVPTLNTDWWNYGGITRDVDLFVVPQTFITDYQLQLTSVTTGDVSVNVTLDGEQGANQNVNISIPSLNLSAVGQTDSNGHANFSFQLPEFTAWTAKQPHLYEVEISSGGDLLKDKVGFRTIATKGKEILLNGEPIFLRGISIHEEYPLNGGGRVQDSQQARYLLNQAKALNANFVRLAHYPHNQHMVRLADEMGLLVWSEIPVYWTISWNNPETYQNAEAQLAEMISRDKNRASVIIWSIANETPLSEARNQFLANLANKARSLDSSRLISAAMEKHYSKDDPNLAVVSDPLSELVDIVSFNQYIGWYEGLSDKLARTKWQIPYNKPVIVSEFGGGAKYGFHGDIKTRWSEEFQADIYTKTLAMLEQVDGWAGVSPWILMDFRSPRRLHDFYQNDFNRKGLLSEKGEKKLAFDVLQSFYKSKADQVEGSQSASRSK
jgi:beta-glucuronidase